MELRQLRYFVVIVDTGSLGRAAKVLGVMPSALSQQMARLESELSTRLLQRSATGMRATDAGLAFYKQAQLALRHADDAVLAAQGARLSGHVSVGLPSSTATVLALPFIHALRERYPDVRLRLVEGLSGQLEAMLSARQLDLAVLFNAGVDQRWRSMALLEERLFLVGHSKLIGMHSQRSGSLPLADLPDVPLLLPSRAHGLRAVIDEMFTRLNRIPNICMEIDGLAVLMDAVRCGLGATIQPGAAVVRLFDDEVLRIEIQDPHTVRRNLLASLPEEELSPAALAARIVLRDVATEEASLGHWPGATLYQH